MLRVVPKVLLTALLVAMSVSSLAGPDEFLMKVHGVGKASGIGPQARQRAIADAQENALRALAGSLVGRKQKLVDALVAESAPFVKSANVVDHTINQGVTRVVADFVVNIVQVRHAAVRMLLPELAFKPRVFVLIVDGLKADGMPPSTKVAETAMSEACEKVGLEVVHSTEARKNLEPQALAALLNETPPGNSVLAFDDLADVAILGTAVAERVASNSPSNVFEHKAHVTLHVIRASDGRVLDGLAADAVVHGVDFLESAAQAIQDACGKLAPQIINAATLAVVGSDLSGSVTLTVETPSTHENIELLKRALESLGIQDVQEVFFSPESARIHFEYEGELQHVLRPLVAQRFPAFRLEQERTFGRQSVLRIVSTSTVSNAAG